MNVNIRILKIFFIFTFFFNTNLFSDNNYLDIQFDENSLKKIEKKWIYKSGVFKDSQTQPIVFQDKIIFLDGHKNLRVVAITNGKEICKNPGPKDTTPTRGIGIYKKNNKEIYAVFVRNEFLTQINILNCKEKINKIKIYLPSVVAPILVKKNIAYVLKNNGSAPVAYNLDTLEKVWVAKIDIQHKKKLDKENSNMNLKWNVWGGGVIDDKYNQLIFSTSNPKPAYVSKNRFGKNLFHNSVVSIDINTGVYKWHFQEIEHDLLNLDLASPPILISLERNNKKIIKDLVVQATKTGQLLLLDRKTGQSIEKMQKKVFLPHKKNSKIKTIKKISPEWLIYSKSNFLANDINKINEEYKIEAEKIINKSIINEYQALEKNKNYIFYGMHGGTEWPNIASKKELIIVPSNNIAWVARLNDNYWSQYLNLFKEVLQFDFNQYLLSLKKIKRIFKKIINFDPNDIQEYSRFVNTEGIPLNAPPWGTLTAIDITNKKKLWTIPHGHYSGLKNNYNNLGSEIFGSPIIVGDIIFMSGTIDKHIIAYNLYSGKKIWSDKLPYVAYGNLTTASFNGKNYLIINSTGGSKMEDSKKGDALIAYVLN